jgi:hypothetical protein
MRLVDKAIRLLIAVPLVLFVMVATGLTLAGCGIWFAAVRLVDLSRGWLNRMTIAERSGQCNPVLGEKAPPRHPRR